MKTQTMLTAGILALFATSLAQADPLDDAKKVLTSPIDQYEKEQALKKWQEEQARLQREQGIANVEREKENEAKAKEQDRIKQERAEREQQRAQEEYQQEAAQLNAKDPVQPSPLSKRMDPDSPEVRRAKLIQRGYVYLPDGSLVPQNDPRAIMLFQQGFMRLPDGILFRPHDGSTPR